MIQLHEDCLLVEQPGGGFVPWTASQLTLEFVGGGSESLNDEVLKQVAAGVLHYFKVEMGRMTITVAEFAEAIAKALNGMGYAAEVAEVHSSISVGISDLRELAIAAGKFGELEFFRRLRLKLKEQMETPPTRLEFLGLRSSVKILTGKKNWCATCSRLEVEIVDLLRGWYGQFPTAPSTALLVRG